MQADTVIGGCESSSWVYSLVDISDLPGPDEEFDFPPPPTEQELNGGHAKQLSEASLLSDASTLKQFKSASVESFDEVVHSSGKRECVAPQQTDSSVTRNSSGK